MKGLIVNVLVPRTNPAVLRRLRLKGEHTLADLGFAAAVALGIQGELLSCTDDQGNALPADRPLSGSLRAGKSCSLTLKEGLALTVDVLQETDDVKDQPEVLLALGLNLPQGTDDLHRIRHIHSEVLEDRPVAINGQVFSRKSLEFSEKRFKNGMMKRFDPEHAAGEVNLELGMPMQQLLNLQKLAELKLIAKALSIYYFTPIRKGELVNVMCEHCDDSFFERLLHSMNAVEYEAFREIVLHSELKPGDCVRLPSLSNIGFLADQGNRMLLPQELLEYYSGIYGTDREFQLHYWLLLRSALKYCAEMYGVFSFEQFRLVARKRTGNVLNDNSYTGFWKESMKGINESGNWIHALNDDTIFHAEVLTRKEAEMLYQKTRQLPRFYLPTVEEMEKMETTGLTLPGLVGNDLMRLIGQHRYDFNGMPEDICRSIIRIFQRGVPPEKVVSKLPKWTMSYYSSRSDEISAEVERILLSVWNDMPLMPLGGFSISSFRKQGLGDPMPLLQGAGTYMKR